MKQMLSDKRKTSAAKAKSAEAPTRQTGDTKPSPKTGASTDGNGKRGVIVAPTPK